MHIAYASSFDCFQYFVFRQLKKFEIYQIKNKSCPFTFKSKLKNGDFKEKLVSDTSIYLNSAYWTYYPRFLGFSNLPHALKSGIPNHHDYQHVFKGPFGHLFSIYYPAYIRVFRFSNHRYANDVRCPLEQELLSMIRESTFVDFMKIQVIADFF